MTSSLSFYRMAVVAIAALAPITASAERLIGLGAMQVPRFAGSADERIDPVPLLDMEGERFFAKTLRGAPEFGVFLMKEDRFVLAAIASFDRGRKAEDSDFLEAQGAPDIDPYASIGFTASRTGKLGPLPWEALVRPLWRLGDSDGWLVDARLAVGVAQFGRFSAQVHGQLTWADDAAQALDFGWPADSVSLSGSPIIAAFTPGDGLRETRFGLSAEYRFNDRTKLLAQWEARRLDSSLKESPVVEHRSVDVLTLGVVVAF